ncbi:Tyrosine recombinase XerD [Planctomycetes bacterium Pan216]|uniref:Tyrosine recombinase XerD n=1 Tax=Kolteria novifilia TaxID=2527975 RepID=A0A518B2P4_9BACT|nr:Tyrosine recombinase XerD [Planctomycetes bacterium Pan216]
MSARKLPPGMRLRGKVYYAWFRHQNQLIRKRLSSDFNSAKKMLTELRARVELAAFGLLDNKYPWDELKREFLKWAKQTTRMEREYRQHLDKFESYRPVVTVAMITPSLVIGYREWRQSMGNVCPRTVNKEITTLNICLNKAVKWRRIESNPIKGLEPLKHDIKRKVRRALSPDEVKRLIDVSPPHLAIVWKTFVSTGLRKDELINLTLDDYDADEKTVTVRSEFAKSGKARDVPLIDSIVEFIEQRKDEAAPTDPIFVVPRTGHPWRNNLLSRFYAYAGTCPCKKKDLAKCRCLIKQRAEIEDARPNGSVDIHSLRVTFVTEAINNGASPRAVQVIVGHATLEMTMDIYTKATDQSKRNALDSLPWA